jgi:hypothetical protein
MLPPRARPEQRLCCQALLLQRGVAAGRRAAAATSRQLTRRRPPAQEALPYLVREKDGRAWLLPVRGGPQVLATCFALSRLYEVVHHLTLPLIGEHLDCSAGVAQTACVCGLLVCHLCVAGAAWSAVGRRGPPHVPRCPAQRRAAPLAWLLAGLGAGPIAPPTPHPLPVLCPCQARPASRPRWLSGWTRSRRSTS